MILWASFYKWALFTEVTVFFVTWYLVTSDPLSVSLTRTISSRPGFVPPPSPATFSH